MLIAIYAAAAMFAQDVLSALLTQAEARNRAHLAGLLDSFAWIAAIATTTLSVSTLQGHDLGRQVAVVLAVSAANYLGTVAGTQMGARWMKIKLWRPPRRPGARRRPR